MEDEDGHTVENANNRVEVHVTGAGRLLGLDNGDSTDYDPYKGRSRRLFSGKLMAIIGATLEPGPIRIEVSSNGLKSRCLHLTSIPAQDEMIKGISACMNNEEGPCLTGNMLELPLRKIELISEGGQSFHPSNRQMVVHAKLHPPETSYQEVEWAVE